MSMQPSENAAPSFTVKGQYIKDLSFENPHAPQSLTLTNMKPAIEVNVDVRGSVLQENIYELTMLISARASVEQGTLFLVELSYGGIFELVNVKQELIERTLLVDGPFVLFPFARRVIADVTRDGGFPPLMLDPIDFSALFVRSREQAGQTATV